MRPANPPRIIPTNHLSRGSIMQQTSNDYLAQVVQEQAQVEGQPRACRKLDFNDPEDPMRIVNLQLREQAEAAIKDKVATMSIDEVLSDKQPIIKELTHRLRTVAEGDREEDPSSGLGLRIVTVQIKE